MTDHGRKYHRENETEHHRDCLASWIADLTPTARRQVMNRMHLKDPDRWREMQKRIEGVLNETDD